jgi:hypothetical protein
VVVPVMDDPIAWCLADGLRACFCDQLAQVSAPVGCCCLWPGQEVAWDDCTPGQAWVRVVQVYPLSNRFPIPDDGLGVGPCGSSGGWAVVLELGAIRCMPQPQSNGTLPRCQEYSDTARLVLADAHAMRRAVQCCDWRSTCTPNADLEEGLLFGAWQPVGPQGGCTGGVMSVTVQAYGCICPPGEPVAGRS